MATWNSPFNTPIPGIKSSQMMTPVPQRMTPIPKPPRPSLKTSAIAGVFNSVFAQVPKTLLTFARGLAEISPSEHARTFTRRAVNPMGSIFSKPQEKIAGSVSKEIAQLVGKVKIGDSTIADKVNVVRSRTLDYTTPRIKGITNLQERIASKVFDKNPSFSAPEVAYLTGSGIGSLGVIAGALFTTRNPTAAVAFGTSLDVSDTYNEARNSGKSPKQAREITAASAVGTAILERIGLGFILGTTAKKPIIGLLSQALETSVSKFPKLTGIIGENTTEVLQTWWQNAVSKFGYDRSIGIFDNTLATIIASTPAATIGTTGANILRNRAIDSIAKDNQISRSQAEQVFDGFDNLINEAGQLIGQAAQSQEGFTVIPGFPIDEYQSKLEKTAQESGLIKSIEFTDRTITDRVNNQPAPSGVVLGERKLVINRQEFESDITHLEQGGTIEVGDKVITTPDEYVTELVKFEEEHIKSGTVEEAQILFEGGQQAQEVSQQMDERVLSNRIKIRESQPVVQADADLGSVMVQPYEVPALQRYVPRQTEKTALKQKIRVSSRSSRLTAQALKKDLQSAVRETKRIMRDARKKDINDIAAVQQRVVGMIQSNLPPEIRGKYLQTIARRLTQAKLIKIGERVVMDMERTQIKTDVAALQKVQKNIAKTSSVHLNYKKRILDLVGNMDFRKMTDDTKQKLTKLSEVIARDGESFGLQDHIRISKRIDRLNKVQASNMTAKEIRALRMTIDKLIAHGKLMRQLENSHNDRILDAEIEQAVTDTVNQDMPIGVEDRSLRGMVGNLLRAHNVFMPTIQVTNKFDGLKKFNGWNARQIKKLSKTANNAVESTHETQIKFWERIVSETGLSQMPGVDSQIRMMLVARYREGAVDAVETLMKVYGYEQMPTLTDQEEQVLTIIQETQAQMLPDLVATYETIENKPYDKQSVYFMQLRYEKEEGAGSVTYRATEADIKPLTGFRRLTSKVSQGFNIARKQGVARLPRVDIFNMMMEDIADKIWYTNIQLPLYDIKSVVSDPRFTNKAGRVVTNWWTRQIDITAKKGMSSFAINIPFLKAARTNLTDAVLLFRITTALLQPFAVFSQMTTALHMFGSRAALDVLSETTKTWLNPRYAKRIITKSQAVRLRSDVGEQTLEDLTSPLTKLAKDAPELRGFERKTILQRLRDRGGRILRYGDVKAAAASREAYRKILTRAGSEDPDGDADLLMDISNASNNVVIRPQAYAYGELARLWLMFQNFNLNAYSLVVNSIIKEGIIKGSAKQKLNSLLALIMILVGKVAEQAMRDAIKPGDEERDRSRLADAVLSMPELIPIVGGIIATSYNGAGEPVILRYGKQSIEGTKTIVTGKKPETKAKAALNAAEAILAIFRGYPGLTQSFDLIERKLFTDKKSEKGSVKIRSNKRVKSPKVRKVKIRER